MPDGIEDAYIVNGGKCRVSYSVSPLDPTHQNTHQRSLKAQKLAHFKQGNLRMEQDRRYEKDKQNIRGYQQEACTEARKYSISAASNRHTSRKQTKTKSQ